MMLQKFHKVNLGKVLLINIHKKNLKIILQWILVRIKVSRNINRDLKRKENNHLEDNLEKKLWPAIKNNRKMK